MSATKENIQRVAFLGEKIRSVKELAYAMSLPASSVHYNVFDNFSGDALKDILRRHENAIRPMLAELLSQELTQLQKEYGGFFSEVTDERNSRSSS